MDTFNKEELKNFIIGLCIICIFALATVLFKLQRNVWKGVEDTDYQIFATFNRTDGLVVGNKVRMSGIDIGRVVDSVLDNDFRATLTLQIKAQVQIPDDSSAAIVSSGIMGNKYIEIEPGGSEDYIEPNGEFSYTQDAMILDELINRVISLGKAKRKKTCPEPKETTAQITKDME